MGSWIPALEAGLLIVAMMSACVLWLNLRPATLFTIGLVLELFSANWGLAGSPIPLDRVFIAAGLGAFAFHVWRAGGRVRDHLPSGGTGLILAAASIFMIGSAAFAHMLTDRYGFFAVLDRGLLLFLAFGLAPAFYAKERDRSVLLGALVAMTIYVGGTAIAEMTNFSALVFPKYIANPDIGIHYGRARGPLLEAADNGVVLFLGVVACAVAWVKWPSWRARMVCGLGFGLGVAGMLLTLTRAVWLGGFVAGAVVLLVVPGLWRRVVPALCFGALLIVGLMMIVPSLDSKITERNNDQYPIVDRINTNNAAIAAGNSHPLFGIGLDRFRLDSPKYLWQNGSLPLTGDNLPVHNVFLARYAELGIIGASLWVGAFLVCVVRYCFVRVRREFEPWRTGLLVAVVGWSFMSMFGPTSSALPNLLLWTWAGVVAGGSKSRDDASLGFDSVASAERALHARNLPASWATHFRSADELTVEAPGAISSAGGR